jgi:membrane fusion protein (multidrug efflux system)
MTRVLTHRKLQSFSRHNPSSSGASPLHADASEAANVPGMETPAPDAAPRSFPAARAEPIEQRRAEKPAETAETKTAGKPSSRRRLLLGAASIAALIGASWYGYDYVTVGQYIVSTDDAYVGADMAIISPKVAANVAEVPIVENQHVKAGDTLVRLDDGDYKLAVDQAAAKLATQKAQLKTYDAQIKAAEATANQTRAQLDSYNASLIKAEADFVRTDELAARDFSPKASLDAARAARDSAKAQVAAGQSAIETADANVAVLKAQRQEAERVVRELEVALAKAERDLSFTVIRAPFNGVIGNRSVQVGDYVTPGKRLAAVVPLDKVYVDANLKETQLANVHPGEPAKIFVDALDGAAIEGTVESVAPASGSQFSLLPPENATGNFTKIVQRVPVRIAVPADKADGKLRPGLSVVVDIDTKGAAAKRASVAAN